MSSLSATQADGYYAPPEYYESGAYKKQSISQYAGSKGHNQYLQRSVVRFELPYDGFCTGCSAHVGKGTRFNAHKSHVDDYFTTKIWEFTTRCRACGDCTFKIRTNPKGRCFDYVEGIRKKQEEFDTQEAGTAGVIDTEIGNGIIPSGGPDADDEIGTCSNISRSSAAADNDNTTDSLSRLERTAAGERKAQMQFDRLESIQRFNNATSKDDAATNAAMRATYRKARQGKKRRLGDAAVLGLGRNIELAEPIKEDTTASREAFADNRVIDVKARKRETDAFKKVRSGSIFGAKTSAGSSKSSTPGGSRSKKDSTQIRCFGNIRSSEEASSDTGKSTPNYNGGASDDTDKCSSRRKRLLIKPPLLHQGQKPTRTATSLDHGGQADKTSGTGKSAKGERTSIFSLKDEVGSSALSAIEAYYGSEDDSD